MKPVYLVGAGPGDPDLITCKGRGILERADVVLHDHLANEALLHLAPPHAELIYVGKKKAVHAHTQEEICVMMIENILDAYQFEGQGNEEDGVGRVATLNDVETPAQIDPPSVEKLPEQCTGIFRQIAE